MNEISFEEIGPNKEEDKRRYLDGKKSVLVLDKESKNFSVRTKREWRERERERERKRWRERGRERQ